MDELTDEERILAWKSSWDPSFAGCAIVNSDFTFRSANPQFCKLLGVTPAELLDERFQDVTHPASRKIDEKNAKLVIEGKIDFYLLKKSYLFENAREVKVVLLVTRVPIGKKPFRFFLSRIMLNEEGRTVTSLLDTTHLSSIRKAADFLVTNAKVVIATCGILGAGVAAFLAALNK